MEHHHHIDRAGPWVVGMFAGLTSLGDQFTPLAVKAGGALLVAALSGFGYKAGASAHGWAARKWRQWTPPWRRPR